MAEKEPTFKVRDLMVPVLPETEQEGLIACTAATCTCTATGWKSLDDTELDAALVREVRGEIRQAWLN